MSSLRRPSQLAAPGESASSGPPAQHSAHAEPNVPDVGHDVASGGCELGVAQPSPEDLARMQNDQHRREAGLWLSSKPLTTALITRQVMEPLRQLMQSQLELGGISWVKKQHASAVQAMKNGFHGEGRSYPIAEAASQKLEKHCSDSVFMLLREQRLWQDLIPIKDQTVATRGLAFRMLSCILGLLASTLAHQHQLYPIRLFKLLLSDTSDVLDDTPPCMFDPWSLDFVTRHRGKPGGCSSEEALAELRLHASLIVMDISAIEATHASIRRRLNIRGVQTHAESLEEVSA